MIRRSLSRPFARALAPLLSAMLSLAPASVFGEAGAPSAEPPKAAPATTLEALGWLAGCWRGAVNQREFREHWLPLRGGMMLGASHTVTQDRTQDFDFLRLETRADGVYYVTLPSGKPEIAFRLVDAVSDENGSQYTFSRTAEEFPQRIVYRRGSEGWLYATVEGRLGGEDRKVTYPMRRIGCESGELILK